MFEWCPNMVRVYYDQFLLSPFTDNLKSHVDNLFHKIQYFLILFVAKNKTKVRVCVFATSKCTQPMQSIALQRDTTKQCRSMQHLCGKWISPAHNERGEATFFRSGIARIFDLYWKVNSMDRLCIVLHILYYYIVNKYQILCDCITETNDI